jgi:hypothetical protein
MTETMKLPRSIRDNEIFTHVKNRVCHFAMLEIKDSLEQELGSHCKCIQRKHYGLPCQHYMPATLTLEDIPKFYHLMSVGTSFIYIYSKSWFLFKSNILNLFYFYYIRRIGRRRRRRRRRSSGPTCQTKGQCYQ